MCIRLITLIIIILLNACATNPKTEQKQVRSLPNPPVRADIFDSNIGTVESLQEIFALTHEQQDHFLEFYNSEANKSLTELDRIFEYLEVRMDNFNFHSDTLIAKDVLGKNTGNCLSLAILTKSLAKLVDIKVRYELVETPTIFQKENNFILNYRHVRTVLHSDLASEVVDGFITQNIMRIDYFPSKGTKTLRRVPENEFYAMFYNNKAVEAMIESEISLAYAYLTKSLILLPANAEAISMMGVLHSRIDLVADAEKLYQYGLKYSSEEEVLLKNYQSLLIRLNRIVEADKIALKLKKYNNTDPFNWIELADSAYQDQDYAQAIVYYRKAAKMASYLHEPYAGIARAKYKLGKNKAASDSILKALANSHNKKTTQRYQSKYEYFQAKLNTE